MAIGMRSNDADVVEIVDTLLGHRTIGDTSTLVQIGVEALMAQVVTQAPLWAALRDTAPTAGTLVVTDGYYSRGDGGGGVYLGYSGAAAGTYYHDGVASIRPLGGDGSAAWVLVDPSINWRQAGAKGDAYVREGGKAFSAISSGTRFVQVPADVVPELFQGMRVCTRRHASRPGVAIPTPTTILSVSGTTVELSRSIANGTHKLLAYWFWDDAGVTGTDDGAAILAAHSASLRTGRTRVIAPPGAFKCGKSIPMGFGHDFNSLSLIGPDRGAFAPGLGGCKVFATQTNAPAMYFEGSRRGYVTGVGLWGPNYCFGQAILSAQDPSPVASDFLAPELLATGSTPGGLQPKSPLVGITIDPFAAAAPAAPYTRDLPSWTGLSSSYGIAKLSSDVEVYQCSVLGFGVDVQFGAVSGSQQDFLKVHNNYMGLSPIVIAGGASQGRPGKIRDNNLGGFHTFLDGTSMGMGQGHFGGDIDNNCGTTFYRVINFDNAQFAGPAKIKRFYGEMGVCVGRFVGSGNAYPLVFEDCEFDFSDGIHGQIPAGYLEAGSAQGIAFRNCRIVSNRRLQILVRSMGLPSVEFARNSVIMPGVVPADGALRRAINGGAALSLGAPRYNTNGLRLDRSQDNYCPYGQTTGEAYANRLVDDELHWFAGGAVLPRVPMHESAKRFRDTTETMREIRQQPAATADLSLAGSMHVAPTITGDQVVIGLRNGFLANAIAAVTATGGWRAQHPSTGTLLLVTGVGTSDGTGKLITFTQQNNMEVDPQTGVLTTNYLTADQLTGALILIPPGETCPREVYLATCTAGSPTLVMDRGDGFAGQLASHWVANDGIWGAGFGVSGVVGNGQRATVSTVTAGSPGSMVMSAGAAITGTVELWPYPIA